MFWSSSLYAGRFRRGRQSNTVKNDYKEWQNPTMSMDMKQEEPSLNLQREYRELRNKEFERLAHIVRNSIDIDKIKEIMRL